MWLCRSRSRSREKGSGHKREPRSREKDKEKDNKGNHLPAKRQRSPAIRKRHDNRSRTRSPRSRPRGPVSPRGLDRHRAPQGFSNPNGRVTGFDNPHRPWDGPRHGGWGPASGPAWIPRGRSPSPLGRPRSTPHFRGRSPPGPRPFEEGRGMPTQHARPSA